MSAGSQGVQGSINNLLAEWWGEGDSSGGSGFPSDYSFSPLDAANLVVGSNPLYQISDFLAVYPKFGTQAQSLVAVVPDAVTPGTNYVVGDKITVVQQDASGGVIVVASVGDGGVPTSYTIQVAGTGYQVTPLINAIKSFIVTPGQGGLGYIVGDLVAINQVGGSGGVGQVTSVGVGGVVTGIVLAANGAGQGYSIGGNIPCSGGNGVGLLINITGITPYLGSSTTGGSGSNALVDVTQISPPNIVCIPPAVLQMYINLASACLQSARWFDYWPIAMAWFVAHFATLYLRSEGNVGTTPGQIAASGLTKGIMVTKSAGNVSAMIEVPKGLDEWGHWTESEYGIQLSSTAKIIGWGFMYIR
jgi:hypothetical protein